MKLLRRAFTQKGRAPKGEIGLRDARALDRRIREDRRSAGVVVEMRRSVLYLNLCRLLGEGVIGLEDLDGFSDDLAGPLKAHWSASPGSDTLDGAEGPNG